MTGPRQPTVVVALHDGFYGCGTGAGYANHALLQALTGLLPADVRLVVLPVHLDPTSPEYDLNWHTETATMLTDVDAMVHPVDNGTQEIIRLALEPSLAPRWVNDHAHWRRQYADDWQGPSWHSLRRPAPDDATLPTPDNGSATPCDSLAGPVRVRDVLRQIRAAARGRVA